MSELPRARRPRRAQVHQTADRASTLPNPNVEVGLHRVKIGVRGISEADAIRLAAAALIAATSLTGAAIGASAANDKATGAAVGGLFGFGLGVASLVLAGGAT